MNQYACLRPPSAISEAELLFGDQDIEIIPAPVSDRSMPVGLDLPEGVHLASGGSLGSFRHPSAERGRPLLGSARDAELFVPQGAS
jgi:hypothetical protein